MNVVRQSSLTSVAAGLAVLAGLLLDITIAASFGAGRATDSFFVASRIPIGLQAIVVAAANQVLVPSFSRLLADSEEKLTWRLASTLVTVILLLGVAFVGLAYLLAAPLMRITAPGLPAAEVAVAAGMVPIVFAVFPLVTISEVMRALLNSRYAFVSPAMMNVVYNTVAVAAILLFAHHRIQIVAWALLAGAVCQVSFMYLSARRHGFRYRPALQVRSPEFKGVSRLTVRPLIAGGTNPIARIAEQIVVSFLPAGSISIVSYGYRLISAIGGTVFFRSVMVALLPRLTEATSRGNRAEIRRLGSLGVRIMLALSVPLTGLMIALSTPAALVVFHRGRFTRDEALLLGVVLSTYSISLIGSALQRALLAPFFARLDTRTPLRNTVYGVAANLVLLPIFVLALGRSREAVVGVALAYSLAQYVNVLHAAYCLMRQHTNLWAGVAKFSLQLALPSALAAALMLGVSSRLGLDHFRNRWTLLGATAAVAALGLAALCLFLALVAWKELRRIWDQLHRSRPGRTAARSV